MGKSTPAPIDYAGIAQQEGEFAKELTNTQTYANRPTQSNPWGDVDWYQEKIQDPATGQWVTQWTQDQTLKKPMQNALDSQMALTQGRSDLGYGMMGAIRDQMGNPMDTSKYGDMQMLNTENIPGMWSNLQWDLPQYQTGNNLMQVDYSGAPNVDAPQFTQQRAEQSIYDRGMSRLGPQQQGETQALEIKLRNQGLTPGDEGYRAAMTQLQQKHTDATQALENESIMGGGREGQRMFDMQSGYRGQYGDEMMGAANFANQAAQQQFGQGMMAGSQGFQDARQAAMFQNQARQQAFGEQTTGTDYYNKIRQQMMNEEMMMRGQALNETNALISGQQVNQPQFTGFQNAGVSQTPQMLQAAGMEGQQAAAAASADNAMWGNLFGALGQAGGMMAMSDRRLKRNIKPLGIHNGNPWYTYDYVWGESAIGVMADEVDPAAVSTHPSGYLMVDYSKI